MDRIFYFLRRSLVRPLESCGVRLQIDLYISACDYVARFLVVGKCIAINLVEAGGIATVENDADIVQFGAAIQLKLLKVGSVDSEQRPLAVGLRKLKAVGGLFDVESQLIGNFLQHIALARASVEIHTGDHRRK